MRNIRVARILAFLILTTVSASDAVSPATIHLTLGKDTLALAEPTMLTVTTTNLSGNDLVVHSRNTFNLPYTLRLFLITPGGEESRYRTGLSVIYGPDAPLYFLLPPGEQATEKKMLWWQYIVPSRYVETLEKLPPGTYKIYGTYRLPNDNVVIYSDTVEFVFLPPEKEYLSMLKDMNHIHGPIYEPKTDARLRRIKDSNTPYSEAAWTMLILRTYDYDSLKAEKSRFDEAYPNSQFTSWLLLNQCAAYLMSQSILDPASHILPELDSLLELRGQVNPRAVDVLRWKGEIQLLTEEGLKARQ